MGSDLLTRRSGRGKDARLHRSSLVLLLLEAHSPYLERLMRLRGYDVGRAQTPEHCVAVCCANDVKAVVLDQCFLDDADGWSLAQSLKMVRSGIAVILVCHGELPSNVKRPEGVDAIVSDIDTQSILQAVRSLVQERARQVQGVG